MCKYRTLLLSKDGNHTGMSHVHASSNQKKILVDFGVCVDDQSAWAIISSPLDNAETIATSCSIGDGVRLYGDDDPQQDEIGPGCAGGQCQV